MIVVFLLVQTSLLFSETFGWGTTSSPSVCSKNKYGCSNGRGCIDKKEWCNGLYNCDDRSDEKYCTRTYDSSYGRACSESRYFRCHVDTMCIPLEGYCDGYTSCPDASDELDCPCLTITDEVGVIHHKASIGNFGTQQTCWTFFTTKERYLNLSIEATFSPRSCRYGNITVIFIDDDFSTNEHVICPELLTHKTFPITMEGGVKIRYRSSWYMYESGFYDVFNITYNVVDRECLNPGSFKCSENSCILPEKLCDGNKDCENGIDEHSCDATTYVRANFKKNLINVTNWMRNQRDADWGWKENTARAVVALHLGNALDFVKNPKEDDLIAKQLELEVATHLLRSKFSKMSSTELSTYINALLVICHDPKNFYGFNLIQQLKKEIENESDYLAPLPYLTLCNAKENVSSEVISRLLKILEKSMDNGFILEIQALALMALSCFSKDDQYVYLTENITKALNDLTLEQRQDGSFGNEYTTSLVIQAFIANNQTSEKDWNFKPALEFLRQKQKTDGSFDDFLTTYLIMPIFNAKSLVDVGKVKCTEDLVRPKEGSVIYDIKSRLGGKIPVKYTLFIGDEKDQIHPIFLRVPVNITAFEVMTLAADIDPKYTFKTHEIKKKTYVYEILDIPNDPENNKFWFLYHDAGNETVPVSTQAPKEMHVHENDHIIMWYKTLNALQMGIRKEK